jgi:hypothetical protein
LEYYLESHWYVYRMPSIWLSEMGLINETQRLVGSNFASNGQCSILKMGIWIRMVDFRIWFTPLKLGTQILQWLKLVINYLW